MAVTFDVVYEGLMSDHSNENHQAVIYILSIIKRVTIVLQLQQSTQTDRGENIGHARWNPYWLRARGGPG